MQGIQSNAKLGELRRAWLDADKRLSAACDRDAGEAELNALQAEWLQKKQAYMAELRERDANQ